MRSPVEPSVEMITISIEGVNIDQCPVSGGHWLDQGELAKLLRSDEKVETNIEKLETAQHETSRLCPRDNTPLEEFAFVGHRTPKVDICPQCGGMWLDSHELSQTLTMLGRPNPDDTAVSPDAKPATPTRPVLNLLARLSRRAKTQG